MKTNHITQSRLQQVLRYIPETGECFWVKTDRTHHGAGPKRTKTQKGYEIIKIDGSRYLLHRLAWIYVNGDGLDSEIDHINQNKSDNRICNLRLATRSQNQANITSYKTNTSGFKGVTWHKKLGKFQSQLKVNGKNIYLGVFDSALAAHEKYKAAALKYFGEFSGVTA